MPRQYATLETKSADLASDFGLDWAKKLFGEEAIASLPLRQAGKNKGKPKGHVIWRRATTGGYSRDIQGPIAAGAIADAWIGEYPLTPRGQAMSGLWLGRVQSLAGSRFFLFEEGRARWREEEERNRREREEMYGDRDAGPKPGP